MKYLNNIPWSEWTRDERFFCASLYHLAKDNLSDFAVWLCSQTGIPYEENEKWDLGYEVCFYRDYLWQKNISARYAGFPIKRTFDLCLFSESKIIIIEAKVFGAFDANQNKSFEDDKKYLKRMPGLKNIAIYVVALASSVYFKNIKEYGRKSTLTVFDGRHITWHGLAEKYNARIFYQADVLYKSEAKFGKIEGWCEHDSPDVCGDFHVL
ncbi:MAG: hypothetical protein RI964_2777 [Pseudomonadota bacterium]|jgi:hypothetical protein